MLLFLGIGFISAATILLEIALLRLFAVQQFYHFAFMAISLALLGAGASGSILSITRRRLSPSFLCLTFGLTTLGAYLIINYLPFDSFSIAWDSRQIGYLALYFLAAGGPFLFAGLLVGSELMAAGGPDGSGSHLVYGANLIGSALGSLAALPVLAALGGEGAVMVVLILAALSGLMFYPDASERKETARGVSSVALGALLVSMGLAGAMALWRQPDFLAQQLSPYKTLSILSQTHDAEHKLTVHDEAARVDVVESGTIHMMPGLSLLSPAGLPSQMGVMLDGDNLMPLNQLSPDSDQARALSEYLPIGLVYQLRPGGETAVLEAGSGSDVLLALAAGANRVTAVEENKLLNELIQDEFEQYTYGLYDDPRVTVVGQSSRVFARRLGGSTYDVVIVALSDPHRPVTSGAYSLTENYLYTVEAFRDYLKILNDDGLLMVNRWQQTPPSESGRLFGTAVAALEALDLDPAERLIAFRTLRTMTVLAARRPFTAQEIETSLHFLESRAFDAVYFPGIQVEDANRYNLLPEPVYYNLFQQILAKPEETYARYQFDIRPPVDDRPFFFHYFKWRQAPEILATLGLTWQPFGGSGYFVLVALLLLVSLASAILILGPLLLWRRADRRQPPATIARWRPRVLVYFACLGLAFLFVEVPLAQRFILILDQPVIALAVVLFAILLFSGLGSLTVRRWPMRRGLGVLVITVALYPYLLGSISELILGGSEWQRTLLTIVSIAPLGYLMGLPFAGGLQIVERFEAGLVPWAWAINGTFSVISSILAVMVALSWGFSAVLWLGAAFYGLAWISFRTLWDGHYQEDKPVNLA